MISQRVIKFRAPTSMREDLEYLTRKFNKKHISETMRFLIEREI